MYNETSIYIKEDLLKKIDDAALKINISRSRCVSLLLVKYMESNQAGARTYMKVKYQKRDSSFVFTTKNIYLRKDIYDMWCDVRKVFKLSASHLIALAIDLYLEDIIKGKNLPNNYFKMYTSKTTYFDDVCINMTIWGIMDEKIMEKLDGL